MEIEIFGKIDPNNPEEYYEGTVTLDGNSVEIDLNFESEEIEEEVMASVSDFLKSLDKFAKKAFDEISKDYDLGEESETARFYLQHHIDESSEDELKDVFGTLDIDKETYFKALSLQRIGLYPEDDESFAVFDIQLPEDFTNYLMAVTFDDSGELSYISMDS